MSYSPASKDQTDDIDLIDLFRQALKTWKVWLLSLILVTLLLGSIRAIEILTFIPDATYSKPIRLTFPNAHKMIFPSGARFAFSDIVSPAVIKQVYEKNRLNEFNVSIAELQRSLSATPYSPSYPFILERYSKLMSDRKLTSDQIAELQVRLEKEIEQATNGETLISLRLHKLEIPEHIVKKILNDIPVVWAEKALKEKGVLDINVQLASLKSLNAELIKGQESLVSVDLLTDKLNLLKQNILELEAYEGIQSVTDPETGMRLADLSLAVSDLNNYTLGELAAPIRMLGLSREPLTSKYYYQDKLNKLSISLNAYERQASAIKEIFNSYSRREISSSSEITNKNNSQVLLPELSTDMLDKLVSLSSDVEKEKYKQQLNRDLLKIVNKIALVESSIADTRQILSALEKAIVQGKKITEDEEVYLVKMQEKLPFIISEISSFFNVSERIYKQLSIESVGVQDSLFIPITNTIVVEKSIIDVKSTLLAWFALLFLTTVIVVPGEMIRNTMKSRKIER